MHVLCSFVVLKLDPTVITSGLTTNLVTSGEITTQKPLTSSDITTNEATNSVLSTGVALTTSAITTLQSIVTTNGVTTLHSPDNVSEEIRNNKTQIGVGVGISIGLLVAAGVAGKG